MSEQICSACGAELKLRDIPLEQQLAEAEEREQALVIAEARYIERIAQVTRERDVAREALRRIVSHVNGYLGWYALLQQRSGLSDAYYQACTKPGNIADDALAALAEAAMEEER